MPHLLPVIKSPQDIKKLNKKELNLLSQEIREQIVSTVSSNGGHLSSNLGAVEISIALHSVFNSPEDKIVWDVGHQCYAHKLLTGRLELFPTLRRQNGLAGFPKNSESPHDSFNTGHSSTSISAALGLLAADRLLNGKNHAIAVIGDGALTGGLAYEALSHAGHLGLPIIVILNDNKMSISPNVGGLSKYLSRLSMKAKYQTFRRHFDETAKKIPFIGKSFFNIVVRLKRAVKAVFYTDNFFVDLGFEYVGPIAGHNIQAIINVLEDVKKLNRPVVIHILTCKGKGYSYAENNPDGYHGVGSFCMDDGIDDIDSDRNESKTFTSAFSDIIVDAAQKDNRIVAITAAMKTGTGLAEFAKKFPHRFYDVGIAEEHAVTFAAGLAAKGLRPIAAIYSTFIQRAVDQIIHDTALQKHPVIFMLDRAGFVSADGETHQGLFDISLFRSLPNITILCPAGTGELRLMLDWALRQNNGPVIIRYPKALCPQECATFSEPIIVGRGVFINDREQEMTLGNNLLPSSGKQICLFFTGSLYQQVIDAADILKEQGIEVDLYNLRFIKPIDEDYFFAVINEYKLAVFIEEGMYEGGFGEYAASLSLLKNCKAEILVLAANSSFLEKEQALGTREELLAINGLDGESIAGQIAKTKMKKA